MGTETIELGPETSFEPGGRLGFVEDRRQREVERVERPGLDGVLFDRPDPGADGVAPGQRCDQADGAASAGQPDHRRLGIAGAERFELVVSFAHQDHAPGQSRVVAPEPRPLIRQRVVEREQAGDGGLDQPGTEGTDGQRIQGDHGGGNPSLGRAGFGQGKPTPLSTLQHNLPPNG